MPFEISAVDFFGNSVKLSVDEFVNQCPICRAFVVPKFFVALSDGKGYTGPVLQAVFRCPRAVCGHAFFAYYRGVDQTGVSGKFSVYEFDRCFS